MTQPAQPDFKPHLELVTSSSTWTDEQWQEHDARIATERAKLDAASLADYRRKQQADYQSAGFPLRAVVAAQHQLDMSRDAIAQVSRWKPGEKNLLILAGGVGCGKTVAATWWALQRPAPPKFIRASTFARTSRYREDRDGVMSAGALVLDDLGVEFLDGTGSFLVDLSELVDAFYGALRPLLITTNLGKEAFKTRYGERVVDRVRECGSWASVNAPSMRPQPPASASRSK